MKAKLNENGMAFVFEIILAAAVIGLLTFVIIKTRSHKASSPSPQAQIPYLADTAIRTDTCKNVQNAVFTHDFTEPSKLKLIEPPVIDGSNVRDRAWPAIDITKTEKVAVYAPADVQLTQGIYKVAKIGESTYDYDLWFQLSCDRWFFINHVTDPVDKIKKLFPDKPVDAAASGNASATASRSNVNPAVSFSSGELIGYTSGTSGAHNFDLGVFDQKHTNVLPASYKYNGDTRELHFICSFDLFPNAIKVQYYAILMASPKETGSLCPQ